MDRLYFGTRARRRARYKRIALYLSLLSLLAMFAGVPGSKVGLQLVQRFADSVGPDGGSDSIEASESVAATMQFRQALIDLRPTPTPSPVMIELYEEALASGSMEEIILTAATEFGIDGHYLVSVAKCESGLDPHAVSRAGYHGLFQFDLRTWEEFGYDGIYNPVAQARTTAKLLSRGHTSRWPNCA